jgi:hypothetical protein
MLVGVSGHRHLFAPARRLNRELSNTDLTPRALMEVLTHFVVE